MTRLPMVFVIAVVVSMAGVTATQRDFDRLTKDELDVLPPSARVRGPLGDLVIRDRSCQSREFRDAGLRRRIVDITTQEWRFFGFSVLDYTRAETFDWRAGGQRRRWSLLKPTDTMRVAPTIAGYWTVTPEGAWIIENQNRQWKRSGADTRWRTPWSAAFVSWVMCESGLSAPSEFRRAVAHHSYIDQAILARDGNTSSAAFAAYDVGEVSISPGDLLCGARRPAYRSVAERRRQIGEGARTHCDVVVALDTGRNRILAIGGNVRATVGLKLLPAVLEAGVGLRPTGGTRPPFAHLRLRAEPIPEDALDRSPTMRQLACGGWPAPPQLSAVNLVPSQSELC